MNTPCNRASSDVFRLGYLVLLFIASLLCACGEGGYGEEEEEAIDPNLYETSSWDRYDVVALEGDAPINPNVKAVTDTQGDVHIFFYSEGELYQGNQMRYQVRHLVWDPDTDQLVGEEEILETRAPNPWDPEDSGLNNCLVLDVAITTYGSPVVAYQGGDIPQAEDGTICNFIYQGDLMINIPIGQVWSEYLGIQGDASAKNPYFTDGYVGNFASIAVDSQDGVHMCAQHYFEYCDWTSSHYPDLMYVKQSMNQLGHYSTSMEERVDEYNTYGAGGGAQSAMGYYCEIVLGPSDNPMIFYVGTPIADGIGEDRRTLRRAIKSGGQWVPEIIEILEDWRVEWISPAVSADGTVGVAYYLEDETGTNDHPDHLRYAQLEGDGSWQIEVVDNTSHCGKFCSLTFDTNGYPVIAYYDRDARSASYRKHEDLLFVRFDGEGWETETVATAGNIGQYNSLWFDENGVAFICTYDLNAQQISIFRETAE
jgi:hypothetical protein